MEGEKGLPLLACAHYVARVTSLTLLSAGCKHVFTRDTGKGNLWMCCRRSYALGRFRAEVRVWAPFSLTAAHVTLLWAPRRLQPCLTDWHDRGLSMHVLHSLICLGSRQGPGL
jgi:hypothetical protein